MSDKKQNSSLKKNVTFQTISVNVKFKVASRQIDRSSVNRD
jgi:hypothetical protein